MVKMENVLPDVARIMAVSELVRLGVSLLIEILRSKVGTLPYYHFPRRVLSLTLPTPFFAPFVLISRYTHTISHILHTKHQWRSLFLRNISKKVRECRNTGENGDPGDPGGSLSFFKWGSLVVSLLAPGFLNPRV